MSLGVWFQDPCECQNSQMPTSFIYCTFIWYSTVSLPFLQVLHLWIQRIDWIYLFHMHYTHGVIFLPWWLISKESTYQCRKCWFDPWVENIPWRRKWQPTPVFLPGNSHEQRSLEGYGPWDRIRVGHNLATKPLPSPSCTHTATFRLWAHLRYIASLVPDHYNKAHIAILKKGSEGFL